jgi:hypothetical protein
MTETQTTAWQPIETAPRGKCLILFAVTDVGPEGQVRNWKMDSGYCCFSTGEWVWEGRRLKPYDTLPTHWAWMPMPPEIAYG